MGKVGNAKRVVGVLLGSNRQGILDVSNSFAGCYFVDLIDYNQTYCLGDKGC